VVHQAGALVATTAAALLFAAGCRPEVASEKTDLAVAQDPAVRPAPAARGQIRLTPIGGFAHGSPSTSAAEISAYDAASKRLFVVNVEKRAIDVLDITHPETPALVTSVAVSALGTPTSVSAKQGLIAASIVSDSHRDPGHVVLLSAEGAVLQTLVVGHHPDMLAFSPDARRLVVANEGEPEPDYLFDPEGSVSVIEVSAGAGAVTQADVAGITFQAFNAQRAQLEPGVRIFPQAASVAADLEPEYLAISPDSRTAWVTCQENNAVVVVDLEAKQATRLAGLGFKDHSRDGNGFDASDADGRARIRPWPVKGIYQPDGTAAAAINGQTFLFTVNDGKHRDYPGLNELCTVAELSLDNTVFPDAADLQAPQNLGRLKTTRINGDLDGDGQHEEIYAYGGRSFAIWTESMEPVFESGDEFERIVAEHLGSLFNSDHEKAAFDGRSPSKGPEPEGITIGMVDGRPCAFIVLERSGGVLVYDVSNVKAPVFETYINTRQVGESPAEGACNDLGPEGVLFISETDSPIGAPLVVVAHEISGTTRIFRVDSTRRDVATAEE
jgi:hypothetical protein